METVMTWLAPEVEIPEEGLPISAAAAACGLSIDALRYYEREGLTLAPADRAPSGRRRYFERDLSWLASLVMSAGSACRSATSGPSCRSAGRRAANSNALPYWRPIAIGSSPSSAKLGDTWPL